jgi:hypothetical protein
MNATHEFDARRYIILFNNSYRKRDWLRFGCQVFANEGFEVVAVQTIPASGEDFAHAVIQCHDRMSLEQKIGSVGSGDFILNLIGFDSSTAWVYDWLGDEQADYAVMTRGGLPYSFVGFRSALGFRDWLRLRGLDLRRWAGAKVRRALWAQRIRKALAPRWWLRAGRSPIQMSNPPYPSLCRAQVIPMVHLDVEAAQSTRAQTTLQRPYAVFLDQMMADHPDLQLLEMECPVDPDRYHDAMARSFREIERQFGIDVVVARHPKATSEGVKRLGRPVPADATSALVQGSRLVLCHYTTAVSYAVIFRKPVLFLTSDDMEANEAGIMVARFSSWLGGRRVNIDHLPAVLPRPVVAEAHYRRYEQVLLFDDAPLDWSEVLVRVAG